MDEIASGARGNEPGWLTKARDWTQRFYNFAIDESDEREAYLNSRTGTSRKGVTAEWLKSRRELDKAARLLETELVDRILPSLPTSVREVFDRAEKPLKDLRFAIHDVMYDGDPVKLHRHDSAVVDRSLIMESEGGQNITQSCPAPSCGARFDSARELNDHFRSVHPSYRHELLIDPEDQRWKISKAVEDCRKLVKDLDACLADPDFVARTRDPRADEDLPSPHGDGAVGCAPRKKRPGSRPHPWRPEIIEEFNRRKESGRVADMKSYEAERLVKWAKAHAKAPLGRTKNRRRHKRSCDG